MSFFFENYVSVEEQRKRAEKEILKLGKSGKNIKPVQPFEGQIVKTAWGKAWCANFEGFADECNRTARGKRYARCGSICHLDMIAGHAEALISGSSLYKVDIEIKPASAEAQLAIRKANAQNIVSLLETMNGSCPSALLALAYAQETGLLPGKDEMTFSCTCPDYAIMCKHVAAALYGMGRIIDENPQLLFTLRSLDFTGLVNVGKVPEGNDILELDNDRLGEIFDIDIENSGFSQTGSLSAGLVEFPADKETFHDIKEMAFASTPEYVKPAKKEERTLSFQGGAGKLCADTLEKKSLGAKSMENAPAFREKHAAQSAKFGRSRSVSAKKSGKTEKYETVNTGKKTGTANNTKKSKKSFDPEHPTGAGVLALRKRAGLSQKKMADILGVSSGTIARWEREDYPVLQKASLMNLAMLQTKILSSE